jgi:hypothetical protein
MTTSRPKAILVSLVLVILLDAIPAAASFAPVPPVALTGDGHAFGFQRSLAATGSGGLVAAYRQGTFRRLQVYTSTSDDGGDTWSPRRRLASVNTRSATRVAIAADGQMVDAVWGQGSQRVRAGPPCTNPIVDCRLVYARSFDAGSSFSSSVPLSRRHTTVTLSQVARRGDIVVVGWTELKGRLGEIKVRISENGGASFGTEWKVGTTSNEPFGDRMDDGYVAVAIGGGTAYVAWFRNDHTLVLRRWHFAGDSWSPTSALSSSANGFAGVSITAGEDDALVAYSRFNRRRTWPVSQATQDDGDTWTAPRAIGSGAAAVPWSGLVVVERIANAHYLAHFTACATNACRRWQLFVRETTDRGLTWPDGYRPSTEASSFYSPSGLAKSGRVVAAYTRLRHGESDVFVRAADHDTPSPARKRRRR